MDDKKLCPCCWQKLNFITDPFCSKCGRKLIVHSEFNSLCGKCSIEEPIYDTARSILRYDEHSKKIIYLFKYYDQTTIADIFAKMIYNNYNLDFHEYDLISPVPMHKFKRLFRFYNQSFLLAKSLNHFFEKQLIPDLLIKTKLTKPQSSIKYKDRIDNVKGTIKINTKYCIKNKSIILIDDVMTSGSTLTICTNELKKHGANKVSALTLASV